MSARAKRLLALQETVARRLTSFVVTGHARSARNFLTGIFIGAVRIRSEVFFVPARRLVIAAGQERSGKQEAVNTAISGQSTRPDISLRFI